VEWLNGSVSVGVATKSICRLENLAKNAVYHVKELKRQLETLQINQNLIDEQHSASSSSGGSDSEEEYAVDEVGQKSRRIEIT
jgi:hypothetical protein